MRRFFFKKNIKYIILYNIIIININKILKILKLKKIINLNIIKYIYYLYNIIIYYIKKSLASQSNPNQLKIRH